MSDTQQGPDWWQASDGKWYAPPRPDWPSEPEPAAAEPETPVAPVADAPADPPPVTEAPTEVDTAPVPDATPEEPEAPEPAVAPPAAPPTEVAPAAAAPDSPPPSGPPLAPPAAAAAGAAVGAAAAPGGPPMAPPPSGPPTELESAAFPAGPPGTGASASGDPFGTPEKNKTPLIIGGVVAAVIAAIIGFVVFGGGDDGDDDTAAVSTDEADEGPGNKEGEAVGTPDPDPVPPPSDDFPEFVDPADADPIEVDESGFVLVPDEFDEGSTNASYGFVITNPNDGLAATSVEVSIGLFDDGGTAVETESAFVSGLLGGQSVGLGGFIRDVPDGVVRMEVTAEASQLVRADDLEGELSVAEIAIQEEEFGGITVTFDVSSTFPDRQENITLYGLFRNAAGEPIGGTQSFLEFVEPGGTSSAELRSFADIPGIDSVDVAVTISASNFFE